MPSQLRKFNSRAFSALMITITGLGLPITGIANHLHQFEPLNPARHAWMAAHNFLGLLFVVFAIMHAVLNRRALANYLKKAGSKVPAFSREACWAVGIVGAGLLLFVGHAFHAR